MMIILYLVDNTLECGCALPQDYVLNIRHASIISIISNDGIDLRDAALPSINNGDIRVVGVDDV
jgi:hypothetical protein